MVVTDIVLLLIMLVGLLRLRRHGGGTFGVTHLLWKQVWWQLSPQVLSSIDTYSFHKGICWLLLATAAGVPPAVSPTFFSPVSFLSSPYNVIGFQCIGLKW